MNPQMNLPEGGLMELNMGPQHPSTHGVIRFILKTDGEIIKSVVPDVGYLHRSIEKISEQAGYIGFMPYTDRVDYVSAMHANAGYAMAVERLAEIEVPRKAEFIRVIVQEFNRIISHFIALGTYAMDMGAFTPFVHLLRERESVNDLLESVCGARLTYNYVWIGGVSHDLPSGFKEKAFDYLDHFDRVLQEFNRLVSKNTIFINRLKGVGIIDEKTAVHYGLAGPNLRASGLRRDIRRDEPYSVYSEIEFEVPVGEGFAGFKGDSYDRFYCRVLEMKESSRIIRQALKMIPDEGDVRAKLPRVFKPRAGESIARVESSRGSMMYYVLSDGTIRPVRVRIRTGSFHAMTAIQELGAGMMISDFISFFASLDIVAPEVDR